MPTFVALLRGVNVGKAKRVPMAELRALLAGLGYTDVATLLNSGNAVFGASKGTPAKLASDIASGIAKKMRVDVPVVVTSAKDLDAIVAENPIKVGVDDHSRFLVAFVQEPKALAKIAALKPLVKPPEKFAVGKRAAYLLCANGILESKAGVALLGGAGQAATTRNLATVLKLQALAGKILAVALLALALLAPPPVQAKKKPSEFPQAFYAGFAANEEIARWLLGYDWAAWKSSDLVMTLPEAELGKLGAEWFCLESEASWDCFYGRFDPEADRYEVSFHYRSESGGEFAPSDAPYSAGMATIFGRAIARSSQELPPEIASTPYKFNTYVRIGAAQQVEVWWIPAGQQDGTLVYGDDLRHTLDPDGSSILDTRFTYTGLMAGKGNPEVELTIDNTERDVPTVGQIFFLLQFRSQFKDVFIINRAYVTTFLEDGPTKAWLHTERKKPKKSKAPKQP